MLQWNSNCTMVIWSYRLYQTHIAFRYLLESLKRFQLIWDPSVSWTDTLVSDETCTGMQIAYFGKLIFTFTDVWLFVHQRKIVNWNTKARGWNLNLLQIRISSAMPGRKCLPTRARSSSRLSPFPQDKVTVAQSQARQATSVQMFRIVLRILQ